jgi:hypothetical protein
MWFLVIDRAAGPEVRTPKHSRRLSLFAKRIVVSIYYCKKEVAECRQV